MRTAVRRWRRAVAVTAALLVSVSGCAAVVDGHPGVRNAPDAHLDVKGTDGGHFDQIAQNALSDIEAFWQVNYPKISGGKSLPPLKGGLYSVDGAAVYTSGHLTGPIGGNACAQQDHDFVVDNGAFCGEDDSISWDRSPDHLFAKLANKYGPLVVALIFAHEFGHSISYLFGTIDDSSIATRFKESQADCAAGAWAASALAGQDPHFLNTTPQTLDDALEGYLDGRDPTPESSGEISHGNGFDRLSAVADGVDKGVSYCFSPNYFASRQFTERPFYANETPQDNTPLSQILTGSNNAFVTDLNRFWTSAAQGIHKSFTPVKIAEAAHPACGSPPSSEFGYCPDDNTVYFSTSFAHEAYYSLPTLEIDRSTADVTLLQNQPGDFALGTLFAIGWGMAVRHQLFDRSLTDSDALTAAICYTGAYARDINVPAGTQGHPITLSPSDLDEGTSAMLNLVGTQRAYGSRGTTGLDRIQSFIEGYQGTLSAC